MTRWMAALLAGFCLAVPGGAAEKATRPQRPNILFLLTDDQRSDALGIAGNPILRTPNLDRLAKDGVVFENAFVTTAICMASRVSYFNGQYERKHGVNFTSGTRVTPTEWRKTYPAVLRQAGYHTGFIGKFGINVDGPAEEKFDYWRGHHGWAKFYPKPHNNTAIYRSASAEIITKIMDELAGDFLENRPKNKPFCLSISFSVPHASAIRSMGLGKTGDPTYNSLYRDKKIPLAATFSTEPWKTLPPELYDPHRNKTYSYYYRPESCREHLVRYYQCITGLDTVVGQIRQKLGELDLADNTVIIFASDHGVMSGEHGIGGKVLLYEESIRIPMIVYDPRLPDASRGRRIEQLVLNIDVAETIISLAGCSVPPDMQGRSLVPLVCGREVSWRGDFFCENLFSKSSQRYPRVEAVRTVDWKYVRYFKRKPKYVRDYHGEQPIYEELYDLAGDPRETRNLAKDPACRDRLAGLRNRIDRLRDSARGRRAGCAGRQP